MTNFNTYTSQTRGSQPEGNPFATWENMPPAPSSRVFGAAPTGQYDWNTPAPGVPEQSNSWAYTEGSSTWGQASNPWEGTQATARTFGQSAPETGSPWAGFGESAGTFGLGLPETQSGALETPRHEQLRPHKERLARFGRTAVELLVKLIPRTSKAGRAINAYQELGGIEGITQTYRQLRTDIGGIRDNPAGYRDRAFGALKSAGLEMAKASGGAALEATLSRYGLATYINPETGKRRLGIESKAKLGRGALRFRNPGKELAGTLYAAGMAAKKAGTREAFSQVRSGAQAAADRYGVNTQIQW